MNILYKSYCRLYQQVLHIALPFLPYREPKLVNSLEDIPVVLGKEKCHKPLVITDRGLDSIGLPKNLLSVLQDQSIVHCYYAKVEANPTTDMVREAYELFKKEGCDALIAIGGGSAIDTAKAVGVMFTKKGKSLYRYKGILRVLQRLPLLIAIPTTAGTGSETTLASVIIDSKTRHKFCINDFPLIPRYAVLDERLTLSLPRSITAETGLDALTHAVEAYIGNSTTKATRRWSEDAVRIIFSNLEKAVENGSDRTARQNMLLASYYAGCAFTRSYVGYIHAIAHSLGGKYNVPHGRANAILLPVLLRSYGNTIHKKLSKLAVIAGLADNPDDERNNAEMFISAIEEMEERFGIPKTFDCIKLEDVPVLAKTAAKEANPLYPVPVLWDAKTLEQFYHRVRATK